MVPTRSSPTKAAGAAAAAAGLAGCEGARTGCALTVCAGRGAGFFFATAFLTGGVFLRAGGLLAGVFCRFALAFFLVAIADSLLLRLAFHALYSACMHGTAGSLRNSRYCSALLGG